RRLSQPALLQPPIADLDGDRRREPRHDELHARACLPALPGTDQAYDPKPTPRSPLKYKTAAWGIRIRAVDSTANSISNSSKHGSSPGVLLVTAVCVSVKVPWQGKDGKRNTCPCQRLELRLQPRETASGRLVGARRLLARAGADALALRRSQSSRRSSLSGWLVGGWAGAA